MKQGEAPDRRTHKAVKNRLSMGALALLSLTALLSAAGAQEKAAFAATTSSSATPGTLPGSLTEQILQGRLQIEAGNDAAMATLQNAAQQSLAPLVTAAGPEILTKSPRDMPRTPAFSVLARQAAEAHYWWGVACDRFAQRDQAIVAFARATRFHLASEGTLSTTFSPAREAQGKLVGILSEGLPLVAPDDTLETISSIAHANPVTGERKWRPLRVNFNVPEGLLRGPHGLFAANSAVNGTGKQLEFLITDGKLFVPASGRDPKATLAQVPPPFRDVSDVALPSVLKISTQVIGFARETEGANRGLWRQVVRVLYPLTYLTRNNRDDLPRAEALCLQFLKVHALARYGLGRVNPYNDSAVTTLWLSEVSALWPRDEDDPAILASLGMVQMPKVNIPSTSKPPVITEIETTPVLRPWLAAGQSQDMPGDIVFFKTTEPRSEAEWLRELVHEYGHVVLPPFNGFRPPLEPFGNGAVGETLGMMWAAQAPQEFAAPLRAVQSARSAVGVAGVQAPPDNNADVLEFTRELEAHVTANALSALQQWNTQGPGSTLRRNSSSAGLQYLQGLSVYIERVYGTRTLSLALSSLPRIAEVPDALEETPSVNVMTGAVKPGSVAVGAGGLPLGTLPGGVPVPLPPPPPPLQSTALLGGLASALKSAFAPEQTRFPIWLPGALVTPDSKLSATDLIMRAPGALKSGDRATCWLFVPADATSLHLEWKTTSGAPALLVEGGWKASALPPTQEGASHALRIDTGGRSGWQRFAFTTPANLSWIGAWFEKANGAKASTAASVNSALRR